MKHFLSKLAAPVIGLFLLLYLVWPSLNPFDQRMFDFHDMTQPGRVTEFANMLKLGQVPPRMVPKLSNHLGFPIFNFYAPSAYWLTGAITLLGLPAEIALKVSFLLGIIMAGGGMYYWLKERFSSAAGWLGAATYVTATYFATEILIRGNLGEVWFLAALPWVFYFFERLQKGADWKIFSLAVLALWFLLTVHNIFSLLAWPLVIGYLLSRQMPRRNWGVLGLASWLSLYFWLPMLLEMGQTQAVAIAEGTKYTEHFLCLNQLWSSNGWQFGGSLPGCGDGMSFKVGKISFLLGLLGLVSVVVTGLWQRLTKRHAHWDAWYMAALFVGSIFLTLPISNCVWQTFHLATFQFPWRFVAIIMVAESYLAAYLVARSPRYWQWLVVVPIVLVSIVVGRKYFVKPLYNLNEYRQKYNTQTYRVKQLAYLMPEYLTKEADFVYWQRFDPRRTEGDKLKLNINSPIATKIPFTILQNNQFSKIVDLENAGRVVINVHYFPQWHILANGQEIIPSRFDKLGRPVMNLPKGKVQIEYRSSTVQNIANLLTLTGLVVWLVVIIRSKWQ